MGTRLQVTIAAIASLGVCALVRGEDFESRLETFTQGLVVQHLETEWAGEGHPVFMTGPAVEVFTGEIEL